MKKLAIFACVMVIGAGAAIAATVNIPFYSDGGPPGDQSGFVGMQNISGGPATVTVTYFHTASPSGELGGTFVLADGESISFNPFRATGSEVQPAGLNDASVSAGSMQISSSGAVTGRYIQFNGDFSAAFGHLVDTN